MTPDRYQRVKEVFYAACELPLSERAAAIEQLCDDDDAIRGEIAAMFALEDGGDRSGSGFLETPLLETHAVHAIIEAIGDDGEPPVPDSIGPYRILRRLGTGGMGDVFEAEQRIPRRTVALKVIRPGIASRGVRRRFEQEAAVLGRLQHPGIAQIFEAGTFAGAGGPQPYFAMELIRGLPLLEFARTHELTARERLDLVRRVAVAVHYAHEQGVVHRDLKPENILVERAADPSAETGGGAGGQPKVLDFGVARATDADLRMTTIATDHGQLLGTIPYMSPEQVAGDPDAIDQRTDVYALGVITYELLTGRRPHDLRRKTVPEAVRIIGEEDPVPLSSIDRSFRGDVATIVGTAMERDPARRYGTAAALAGDIDRYLSERPVVARRPSRAYHLRKFARRNKALVAGVLIAFVALLAASVTSSLALVRMIDRAEEASRKQVIAQQVSEFLRETLAPMDPSSAARRDVSDLRDLLDAAARRATVELASSPEVAAPVHLTIGNAYRGLAVFDEARVHLTTALAMSRSAFGDASPQTAEALDALGDLDMLTSAYPDAIALFREALVIREGLGEEGTAALGDSYNRIGAAQRALGDYTSAEASFRHALDLHEAALGAGAPAVAKDLNDLGALLADVRELDEAATSIERALEIRRDVLGERHLLVAESLSSLAWVLRRGRQFEEAEQRYRESLDIRRAVLEPDHPDIAMALERLAATLQDLERYDEAERLYLDSLEIQRTALGPRHRDVGTTLNNIGGLYRRRGRPEEAEPLFLEAIDIYREQIGPDHVWTAILMENLARLYVDDGAFLKAEPWVAECIRIRTAYFGDRDEGSWPVATVRLLEGLCLADRGRYEEAETILLESIAVIEKELGTESSAHARAVSDLRRLYEMWGKPEKAAVPE